MDNLDWNKIEDESEWESADRKLLTAGAAHENQRLDRYLSDSLADLSRSYLQKLVKESLVQVNGQPVKSNYRLHEGDRIEVEIPEAVELEIAPEDIPLEIVYEDDCLLVVNKPKGMVVHPSPGHYSHTLVNGLLYHCRNDLSGINGVLRPGIVHRIDMDTSGLLVVCKNDLAHNHIAAQLKEHSITRRYQALAVGNLREDEGTVDAPVGRHPVNRLKMAVNYKNGKRAVTHYRVLERLRGYTWIECELETGRTHQIRVHLSSIGHPLLGDVLYGGPRNGKVPGQVLHAKTLGFIHPKTGQYMEFDSELPEYFQKNLESLRKN